MKNNKILVYIFNLFLAIFLSTSAHSDETTGINGDGNISGDGNTNTNVVCQEGAYCPSNNGSSTNTNPSKPKPAESNEKLSTSLIVGSWKSETYENEYGYSGTPLQIFWDIKPNGTTNLAFQRENHQATFSNSTYTYETVAENKGIWREKVDSGVFTEGRIEWVSKNEFTLIIIMSYKGAVIRRRFTRTNDSIVSVIKGKPQPTTPF